MSRKDPATMEDLTPSDYLGTVREAAYAMLSARNYEAVTALHAQFLDIASAHFTRHEAADTNEMRTYYASKRRDALDLAYTIEQAANHAAQCQEERDNPGST